MQVEKIQTIKDLVLNLRQNRILRYCCGFEFHGETPSESTFSRFLNKLTQTDEIEKLFHKLVILAKDLNIIDCDSVYIDSTKLDFYGATKSKKIKDDGTNPNLGMKRDTNVNNIRWFDWKFIYYVILKVNYH
ncbi:MAG: transposase [Firmicutes bacterium]|nr:transposase [Bacillota bacterium]